MIPEYDVLIRFERVGKGVERACFAPRDSEANVCRDSRIAAGNSGIECVAKRGRVLNRNESALARFDVDQYLGRTDALDGVRLLFPFDPDRSEYSFNILFCLEQTLSGKSCVGKRVVPAFFARVSSTGISALL